MKSAKKSLNYHIKAYILFVPAVILDIIQTPLLSILIIATIAGIFTATAQTPNHLIPPITDGWLKWLFPVLILSVIWAITYYWAYYKIKKLDHIPHLKRWWIHFTLKTYLKVLIAIWSNWRNYYKLNPPIPKIKLKKQKVERNPKSRSSKMRLKKITKKRHK